VFKNKNNQDEIYGVISFTGSGTHACFKPAGFMDVCEYKKWIEGIIKK